MSGVIYSLDGGGWRIAADPANGGREQAWWHEPVANSVPVRVPGIIQESLPGYHGVAWYWRDFDVAPHPYPDGRYLLRFWAVDYAADVWVNGVHVGAHEGGETPFVLDATQAVRPGEANRMSIRVLNPTEESIDGFVLKEIPHRNKTAVLKAGSTYNFGGIIEPVEMVLAPPVRIEDIFVRADWQTGRVNVQVAVDNHCAQSRRGSLTFAIGPDNRAECVAASETERAFPSGVTRLEAALQVDNHRLWELDDPFLYRLTVCLQSDDGAFDDAGSARFGFRDFRVERGYFRLNGRRVFLRSSHTGNHCPVGQVLAPSEAPDLLRKDLLYAKASGFNMIRFIAGMAHPWQLDLCDELGLMVYEETLAGWELGDSPKMVERYDHSTAGMILRDRNHPCVTIWGLLNETKEGPVFRHAVEALSLVRSLDDTRLTLLGSGRWDGQLSIGSVSNPGSAVWEHTWGEEDPDHPGVQAPQSLPFGGYTPGAGDVHAYPQVPQTRAIEDGIRTLGRGTKPVFLSEYGIGSLCDVIRELGGYEQRGINPALDDVAYFRLNADKFRADWERFCMDGVYPFPEDMLRESQRLHCRQRLLGFDLIRSNPMICGFNLTGLLDHGFSGEGLWTFWREWKPGIVDALKDGWAPLRWCLFVRPLHGYIGERFRLEAVLANEDVLAPGEYPVVLRIVGAAGVAWEHEGCVQVPRPDSGEDVPFALPIFDGEVVVDGPPGPYQFAAQMARGGVPAGGRLQFHLSDPSALPTLNQAVKVWGIGQVVQDWLARHGVDCAPFEKAALAKREVVLVGDLSELPQDPAARLELVEHVARGGVAVFLSPGAFKRGEDDALGWLPVANKGSGKEFSDWLYHKECVAKPHPIFEGLPVRIMDWDYYGPVISRYFFEGQDTPDETVVAAFAVGHPNAPGGCTSGVLMGIYRLGEGQFVINSLKVLEHVGRHPAADRLLLNLIRHAARVAGGPLAGLPPDFDQHLAAIEYR